MRRQARRGGIVMWSAPTGWAERYRTAKAVRPRRIRRWFRTGAWLAILGITHLARIARVRWRPVFIVSGALLTLVGLLFMTSSDAMFNPGPVIFLFGLLKGTGRPHCESANQMARSHWRG